MLNQHFRWKNKQIREQINVVNGKLSPTLVLKNTTYLHSVLKEWVTGHIWIHNDRIVYAGDKLPDTLENCDIEDCTGKRLVPGYIEPHVHPFQIYNPQTFSQYASQKGTTTFINDNFMLFTHLDNEQAFSLLDRLNATPYTMYWWARLDSQTEIREEDDQFTHKNVKEWLEHPAVIQAGELTGWPKLLAGDDMMLHWIQETKRLNKKVEGHFPGASEKTLARMKLAGADADHEAMTGEEVKMRLQQGYTVSLRHSSIRPDLPKLLTEMKEMNITQYDHIFFNTDGATPTFYKEGVMDWLIRIALEHDVPVVDAYLMASYNIAKYYHLDHLHGIIATGRIANINILESEHAPTPVSVLSKGKWLKKDGQVVEKEEVVDWNAFGLAPIQLDWELTQDDLQFSMPVGIHLVNNVITKPYTISTYGAKDGLSTDHDESYLALIDRHGKWRINTMIKGFSSRIMGFASSYSTTGDIVLIGKRKEDMLLAFNRMKQIGGGMVVAEQGEIVSEIALPLAGMMSNESMETLMHTQNAFVQSIKERGYPFEDPIFTMLFLSATHLPYIRLTPKGMFDVMNKIVLFPAIMR